MRRVSQSRTWAFHVGRHYGRGRALGQTRDRGERAWLFNLNLLYLAPPVITSRYTPPSVNHAMRMVTTRDDPIISQVK